MTDAISDQLRKSDTLGRLDPTTFALIMPQTPAPKAASIRNRIEILFNRHQFDSPENGLTFKFAVASLKTGGDETSEDLFARATERLK